jgi:cell division protein FtsZ
MRGTVNLDFADVRTILKDGGVAIMSTGFGEGDNRVTKAIDDALHSPLLNNNNIFNSKKVMLNVSFCEQSEMMMDEMNEIHDFMRKFRNDVEVIWGMATDNTLNGKIKITLLATGFGMENVPGMNTLLEQRMAGNEDFRIQLEEKREKDIQRIAEVYGTSIDSQAKITPKRREIYIYNIEDMDNDDIICAVDNSPTYLRDRTTLKNIQSKTTTEKIEINNDHTNTGKIIFF